MKKITLIFLSAAVSGFAADCPLKKNCPVQKFNKMEYGTLSGRVQWLTMYRDYTDDGSGEGANSTLGLVFGYVSPEFAGFDFGLTYNVAAEIYEKDTSSLMANDDINVLNEAWLRYRITTNTAVTVGRKVNIGEVFQANDFRQKARSIEAVQLETTGIKNLKLNFGHAFRMSNWIDSGDRWEFNDFGDVFGADDDTDGITWGEAVYTGVENLEVALFNAYAYDVANLIGTRAKWNVSADSALVGTYRHESDVGDSTAGDSDAFGVSFQQKVGKVTVEPGWFGVRGDNLRFQETTTGINHPLGASMMIYSGQFAGESDTAYLKAVAKLGKTVLYGLYNYTWHDELAYDGQELNVVVKQPICDSLSIVFKGGVGHRENDSGRNTTAVDARLFVTYNF